MPKWLDDILSSRKETEKESPTEINREISLGPRLSSSDESAQRQRDERAMKERLDAFLKIQEEEDGGGDFTAEDRDQATNTFLDQDEAVAKSDKHVTTKEMDLAIEEALLRLYSQLESEGRLLPTGLKLIGEGIWWDGNKWYFDYVATVA
jgi:hypothetical protein